MEEPKVKPAAQPGHVDVPVRFDVAKFFGAQTDKVVEIAQARLLKAILDRVPRRWAESSVEKALRDAGLPANVTIRLYPSLGFRVTIRPPGDQRFRL